MTQISNIVIGKNFVFENKFNYDNQDNNLIIIGKIHSNSDIVLKVKNCVICGELFTLENITINASENIYVFGEVKVEKKLNLNAKIVKQIGWKNGGIDDVTKNALQSFGVHLSVEEETLQTRITNSNIIESIQFS